MLRLSGATVLALAIAACGGGNGETSSAAQSTTVSNGQQPIDLKRAVDAPRMPRTTTVPSVQRSVLGSP
jgi:hypothetical protein